MNDNYFEAQYDLTRKSKIKRFYEENKVVIFSFILILVILIGSFTFYVENKKNKKIVLSEKYVAARIYVENKNLIKATDILKEVVYANDPTYSTLSFFLILNQNLITDYNELSSIFDHLIDNNKFDKEVKNLLLYKRAVFKSNFATEAQFLKEIKPLLNEETLWKPHALLLLGDFFLAKNEKLKAKQFYNQILSIKNIQKEFYDQARSQLILIGND